MLIDLFCIYFVDKFDNLVIKTVNKWLHNL